ncbi:MAG: mycothiol system anti-sigma-R factor [Actinobacteria bacterium]|nr:MAG: mycothiol system anti-sigma-R factor [Actinomycetota bacterium]
MEHPKADCRSFLARLYLYLDGEIDELSKADIDRHLELCTGCERHLVFERDLKALVRKKCSEQPDAILIERLRVEIQRRL